MLAAAAAALSAQPGPPPGGPLPPNPPVASLKGIRPPAPTGLDRYVADADALVVLGKALFWDMQVGSDGRTACATCHFHAGADHRRTNQLSGTDAAVNRTLTTADFPFHQLANIGNNRSNVIRSLRQVAGSMGVIERAFAGLGSDADESSVVSVPSPFEAGGVRVRQVTGRNSPSVINAVFNVRNFWDGRASNIFTGATPFGDSDRALNAWVYRDGSLTQEAVRIENASLASQAVGPPLNSVEMSWAGRDWAMLGRRMLAVVPLARQRVAADDSVLGPYANIDGKGLAAGWTYASLIRWAFRPEYWSAPDEVESMTQIERNFALFWGLALQAYQSTLVADDSRVDRFLNGDTAALTAQEQAGLREFQSPGAQCNRCHGGAEMTAAGYGALRQLNRAPANATEAGYFRIGVRPIEDDLGFGGDDGFGVPLFLINQASARGTFKSPSLRNVEFTGPYFHNGGQATLEQVLEFYSRNGDFPEGGNLGPGIGNIRLGAGDRAEIAAFLRALSDDRVRFQRAPFDHPSLCVPNGHEQDAPGQLRVDVTQAGVVAADRWALVQEVGRSGLSVPLQTFDELLRGIGNDGSRANTMTESCVP